jgi:drug/metabolite transporter (DMT)-like permease
MSAPKWFLVVVFVIGVVLFLFGANYGTSTEVYDPVVGWIGVALAAAGMVGFLLIYVYEELTKRTKNAQPQKP